MPWPTGSATRPKPPTDAATNSISARKLMEAWAVFSEPKVSGKIVPSSKH